MRVLKSILVFSSALVLVAILFELLLSFGGILSPIVRIDPDKGERYHPDKTACSIFVSEGFGLAKTNSAGWFGKEFKDNGPNDISVAVIGSSWVASRQVFYRDNFLSVAEKRANEKLHGERVSFFNFGKEDLPLKELLYVKEDIASTYSPDHILIFLNNGSFNVTSQRYVAYYDFIDGKFQIDTSFKEKPFVRNYRKFRLLAESSVLFLAHRAKNHLPEIGEIFFDKFYVPSEKPIFEKHEEANEITLVDEAIIKKLASDERVIFLLNTDEIFSNKVKPLIGSVSVIDVRIPLQRMSIEQDIDPYFWKIPNKKGHWNIPAHKLVGEEIARYMVTRLNSNQ